MPNDEELLTRFSEILADLLDDDSISLNAATVRADIAGWDSFSYVAFLAAIEVDLGIQFGVGDVESFESVGQIVEYARARI